MSMIGNYYMTDRETVEKIQAGELAVEDLIYGEDDNVDEECLLDIDKTWYAIHFTLTGEIDEADESILTKVVFSANPINDEDVGYGPVSLIGEEEVKEIDKELKNISQADFRSKFNLKDMIENEIYPVMEGEDESEFFEYVWVHFEALKNFFSKAASQNKCILFYIN